MTTPQQTSSRSILLSKQGMVVIELAQDLLTCVPGDRIGRVQEYAARLDASVGTVQAALEYLQSAGAAVLEARGRLGTFVLTLDYIVLWKLGYDRPIIGALPLPYSRRFAGLATGFREQFSRSPIGLDLRFTRGAAQRLHALAEGACDWVLVSRFAAENGADDLPIVPLALLGAHTYMPGHSILMRADATELHAGMRVGIDRQSLDHIYSVQAACRGIAVEFVPIEYSRGAALVDSGQIDATVWSSEDLPLESERLRAVPFSGLTDPHIAQLCEAAIVVRRDDRATTAVLGAVVQYTELIRTQNEVVEFRRRPEY